MEAIKMTKLSDFAKAYEPKQVNNIAELEKVSTDADVKEESESEFPYHYIEVEGQRYKVPNSVLTALKSILEDNANLKTFKVKKSGEGMNTRYTVIPLA